MEKITRFALDNAGNLLVTGTATVYRAGTTTPVSIYSADSLASPLTNPINLSTSNGEIGFFARNGAVDIAVASGAFSRTIGGLQLFAGLTSDVFSARPATGGPDQLYFATDLGVMYQYNGSAWVIVSSANLRVEKSRASNTILGPDDNGAIIRATASFTQTFTAAATLGNGWHVYLNVADGFVLTEDPNGAETINGLPITKTAGNGQSLIYSDGANLKKIWLDDNANVVTIADSATPDLRRDINGSRNLSADAGTTAWTAPVLRNGESVNVKFGTSRLLTNGASFVLSGGLSRSTVSGQVSHLRGEASSLVREIALGGAGPVLLAAQTASASAQIDFDLSGFTGYTKFRVEAESIVPATDDAELQVQFSTDGGSSFLTTAYDYNNVVHLMDGTDPERTTTIAAGTAASIASETAGYGLGNAANEFYSSAINFFNLNQSAKPRAFFHGVYDTAQGTPNPAGIRGYLCRDSVATHNAIRFKMSSGNIASGTFKLFGVP